MEGLEGLNLRPLKLPTSATCSSAAAAATDPIFSQTDSSLSHQLGAALQQQAATALAVAAGERGRQMELATATSLLSPRAAGQPSSIYNELQTLKAQLQGVKGRLSDPPPPSYPSFSPVPKSPRKAQESSRSSPPAVASSEMQALVSEVSAMRSQMQMFAEVLMSQGSLLKSIQLQLNEALQSSREQRQEVHTHAPTDQSLQAALDDETRAGQRQRKYGSNDVAADQSSSAVPRSGPIELQGVQDELITPPPGLRALAEWQSEVSPLKTPYGVTRGLLSAPHTSSSLVLPARFIPNRGQGTGPAIWVVQQSGGGEDGIVGKVAEAVGACLDDEVERRSRGLAGAQASAKLAWSLVGNVWGALDEKVIAPALQKYVMTNSATGRTANTTTRL